MKPTKEMIEEGAHVLANYEPLHSTSEEIAEAVITAALAAMPGPAVNVKPLEWEPPQDCDGKEQLAFETWASGDRYDMHEHPMHYLFIDPKTYAARQGWKAALKYVRDQFSAITPATDLKSENERLREALEFYSCGGDQGCDCFEGKEDRENFSCGFKAKAALERNP